MIILLVNVHLQQESQKAVHAWSLHQSTYAGNSVIDVCLSSNLAFCDSTWQLPILHCHMAAVLAWVHIDPVKHLPCCVIHKTGAMPCCRRCTSATCMPPHSQPWSSGVSHGTTMWTCSESCCKVMSTCNSLMAGESNVASHNPCLFIVGQLCTCTEAVSAALCCIHIAFCKFVCSLFAHVLAFSMYGCQAEDLTAELQSYRALLTDPPWSPVSPCKWILCSSRSE